MRKQGSGWRNESRRHSLARKGIKTAKGITYSPNVTIHGHTTKSSKQIQKELEKDGFSSFWTIQKYYRNKWKLIALYPDDDGNIVEHISIIQLETSQSSNGDAEFEMYIPSGDYILGRRYRQQLQPNFWGTLKPQIDRNEFVEELGLQTYEELWDVTIKSGTPKENKAKANKLIEKWSRKIEELLKEKKDEIKFGVE